MKPPRSTVLRELLTSVPPPSDRGRRRKARRPAPRRRASYTLPEDLLDAFAALCAEQDRAPRAVVEELLRSYVVRHQL